jgi:hypothetical protein
MGSERVQKELVDDRHEPINLDQRVWAVVHSAQPMIAHVFEPNLIERDHEPVT